MQKSAKFKDLPIWTCFTIRKEEDVELVSPTEVWVKISKGNAKLVDDGKIMTFCYVDHVYPIYHIIDSKYDVAVLGALPNRTYFVTDIDHTIYRKVGDPDCHGEVKVEYNCAGHDTDYQEFNQYLLVRVVPVKWKIEGL